MQTNVEQFLESVSGQVDPPETVIASAEERVRDEESSRGALPTAGSKDYFASIYPGDGQPLPRDFVSAVRDLEKLLGMPVWLFVQNGTNEFSDMGGRVMDGFVKARHEIPEGSSVALLLHSLGGYAKCAFSIARTFQRRTEKFYVVVPRRAKSAATLLALGADKIILNDNAELGPLDAQMLDHDRETNISALDEVKALDRLHAFSLEALDPLVMFLRVRTGKKIDTILPSALKFVSDTVKPLVDKIDTVHFTYMSRVLKEAEEYAKRLLYRNYNPEKADNIAHLLVENYPAHDFLIDADEAKSIGLEVHDATREEADCLERIAPFLHRITAIGQLKEVDTL